jgi:hypothetical protein
MNLFNLWVQLRLVLTTVEERQFMTTFECRLGNMPAEKAGATYNQKFHIAVLLLYKVYAISITAKHRGKEGKMYAVSIAIYALTKLTPGPGVNWTLETAPG